MYFFFTDRSCLVLLRHVTTRDLVFERSEITNCLNASVKTVSLENIVKKVGWNSNTVDEVVKHFSFLKVFAYLLWLSSSLLKYVVIQLFRRKRSPGAHNRSGNYKHLFTILDALLLNYRRLAAGWAVKLGPWRENSSTLPG